MLLWKHVYGIVQTCHNTAHPTGSSYNVKLNWSVTVLTNGVMLCDFWGQIIKIMCTSTLFFGIHFQNPSHHAKQPHGGITCRHSVWLPWGPVDNQNQLLDTWASESSDSPAFSHCDLQLLNHPVWGCVDQRWAVTANSCPTFFGNMWCKQVIIIV